MTAAPDLVPCVYCARPNPPEAETCGGCHQQLGLLVGPDLTLGQIGEHARRTGKFLVLAVYVDERTGAAVGRFLKGKRGHRLVWSDARGRLYPPLTDETPSGDGGPPGEGKEERDGS